MIGLAAGLTALILVMVVALHLTHQDENSAGLRRLWFIVLLAALVAFAAVVL